MEIIRLAYARTRIRYRTYRRLRKNLPLKDLQVAGSRFGNRSRVPIEVMLPVANKDAEMLPDVVGGIRRNVVHPIVKITIVGAAKGPLPRVAQSLQCCFCDESTLLPITSSSIKYDARGYDRSGWLFQQLLKIEFARRSGTRYCLACDADTVFVSRQSFVQGNKVLFHFSDELHAAYRQSNYTLLGRELLGSISFVSHHAMFDREIVRAMVDDITDRCGCPWYEAIVALARPDEPSVFSEYELYGSYFVAIAPKRSVIQYWHNVAFPRSQRRRAYAVARLAHGFVKTVSFHSYPEGAEHP